MTANPYIPNSTPAIRERMLREIGVTSAEDLYAVIPEALRFRGRLDIPDGMTSEHDLRAHVEGLLGRNTHTGEALSFLGGGCARHFIPAVCDEIGSRGEFLTGYHDGSNSMLGSYQTQFEFQSMLGSLVGRDMVSTTTYDWGTAAASSLLMAARLTGRGEVVVPALMSPIRRRQLTAIAGPTVAIREIAADPATGGLDLEALASAVSTATAAVYLEVPAYLGTLEPSAAEISAIAHQNGALFVVGVDPISLGVLDAPATYGADIVCGDIQPLGVHMFLGGGLAGFIATPHEERYVRECPTLLVSILETQEPGEFLSAGGTSRPRRMPIAATRTTSPGRPRRYGRSLPRRTSRSWARTVCARSARPSSPARPMPAGQLATILGVDVRAIPGAAHFKDFVLHSIRATPPPEDVLGGVAQARDLWRHRPLEGVPIARTGNARVRDGSPLDRRHRSTRCHPRGGARMTAQPAGVTATTTLRGTVPPRALAGAPRDVARPTRSTRRARRRDGPWCPRRRRRLRPWPRSRQGCAERRPRICPSSRSPRCVRHFTRLSQMVLAGNVAISLGLGTTTMKYNPMVHERADPLSEARRPAPRAG